MIGIIGNGYVGTAIASAFEAKVYDIVPEKRNVESIQALQGTSPIFVCVPTPMKPDRRCDTSILESVLSELNHNKNLVVIKSTIPPGTTDRLAHQFGNLDIVFSPEFLREATYLDDFFLQEYVIFGRTSAGGNIDTLVKLFLKRFPNINIIDIDAKIAEMVKYITNSYLATKVIWANEIKQICTQADINYDKAMEIATTNDNRIGTSHVKVPGKDGQFGFGGSCLPKDLNALIMFAKDNDINTELLETVWMKNLSIRENRDWESMKGRAVQ